MFHFPRHPVNRHSTPGRSAFSSPMQRSPRRDFLRRSLAGLCGVTCGLSHGCLSYRGLSPNGLSESGWLPQLAQAAERDSEARGKSCILLWMSGGPSQIDTFDLKRGHANGGPFEDIDTAVSGIRISEHLPGVAQQMRDLSIIRSLSTNEGEHGLASELMLTGYRSQQEAVQYPSLGSLIAKELGRRDGDLPSFISLSPNRMAGAGFLGPDYAPLNVSGASDDPNARANLTLEDLLPPRDRDRQSVQRQVEVLRFMQEQFAARQASDTVRAHAAGYAKAIRMMETQARNAFQLEAEPASLRDAYGRNRFGQSCLLARRLVERGVAFVEVTLSAVPGAPAGWDTHGNNFTQVQALSQILDPAWSTLMTDLRDRGMLDSTLVVWMGEFGRTPRINRTGGRDHFPLAWSMALGGSGIRGGQVIGRTDAGGERVADRPVSVADLYATLWTALQIDPTRENISPEGRPIGLVDRGGQAIPELLS